MTASCASGSRHADQPTTGNLNSITAPGIEANGDVVVRSPAAPTLAVLLHRHGAMVTTDPGGALAVTGLDAEAIGDLAAAHRIPVHELAARHASLEEAFMELTRDHADYQAGLPAKTRKAA
jgi:hypothetical protein